MTAKIKLNAASGGGSFSLQAPSSSSNNRVISLPDIADGTLVTSQSTLDATKLSGNLPAISGANLTGISAGISMHDNWYVSSAFSLSTGGTTDITSNWTRDTRTETGSIGSAMTESSGVFTFPSTGIYRISIRGGVYGDSSSRKYYSWTIRQTRNNSSYSTLEAGYNSFTNHGTWTYSMFTVQGVVDITTVGLDKVKFAYSTSGSGLTSQDIGTRNLNVTFTRLGDT